MTDLSGMINQYTCPVCGETITTINRIDGTTPAMITCPTEGCRGNMHSAYYMVDQDLTPDHEWYKPSKLPRDPDMRQHVKLGGLLLRKIERWMD